MLNYKNYFKNYFKFLNNKTNIKTLKKIIFEIKKVKENKKKIIICGNGGSAGSASHLTIDFTKNARIRAINFNEPSLITALSNDTDFKKSIAQALFYYADKGDIIIFLSVSGESKNLVNGLKFCKMNKLFTISFTGSNKKNFINKNSDLKIHIPSYAYNKVECAHLILLTYIVDSIVGKAKYKV
jgi:D-sedoheptulose 7-phosphate isomerase